MGTGQDADVARQEASMAALQHPSLLHDAGASTATYAPPLAFRTAEMNVIFHRFSQSFTPDLKHFFL